MSFLEPRSSDRTGHAVRHCVRGMAQLTDMPEQHVSKARQQARWDAHRQASFCGSDVMPAAPDGYGSIVCLCA